MKLGILASHGGSLLEACLDARTRGELDVVPAVVVSNNSDARALRIARAAQIPAFHLSARTHPEPGALDQAILTTMLDHGVEVVFLAGYLKRLGEQTLRHFAGKVINVHPSLLPDFGGEGMFGLRVHAAVIDAGARESGVTVHVVVGEYDTGPVLAQRRVAVAATDTPETLAAKVQSVERTFVPEVIQQIATGHINLARYFATD